MTIDQYLWESPKVHLQYDFTSPLIVANAIMAIVALEFFIYRFKTRPDLIIVQNLAIVDAFIVLHFSANFTIFICYSFLDRVNLLRSFSFVLAPRNLNVQIFTSF